MARDGPAEGRPVLVYSLRHDTNDPERSYGQAQYVSGIRRPDEAGNRTVTA